MTEVNQHSCRIPEELAGQRLDQALARLFPQFSRSRLQKWIREGLVQLDGAVPRPRDSVLGGEHVVLTAQIQPETRVVPQAIPLDIVYEDEALIVVDKPAGLVVHPGAGNRDGTLQNALLKHAPELAKVPRAGLVHRIDKQTTGLLVIARTLEAHTALVAELQAREFKREYEAVCVGVLTAGGVVEAPLGRHPTERKRMVVRDGGRHAVTHYRVITRFRAHTHVSLRLETGRTHQIRVHMAHIRHPLVGDPVYGGRPILPKGASAETIQLLQSFRRQALHARRLGLTHPLTGAPMEWESPLPQDMVRLIEALAGDLAEHEADDDARRR